MAPHTYRFIRFYSSPLRLPRSTTSKTRRAREREKGIENNGRSIPGAIGRRRSSVARTRSKQARIRDESRRPIHKGKSERVFDAQVKRGRENERSEIWRGTENKRWEAAASFLPSFPTVHECDRGGGHFSQVKHGITT